MVTFERAAACEAVGVWGAQPNSGARDPQTHSEIQDGQLLFLDSVTTDLLQVRLRQAAAVAGSRGIGGLDEQPVQPNEGGSGEAPGGFVYYVGSGGGMNLAGDALAGGGAAPVVSGAVAGTPQAVVGLTLECASKVEFSSVSGAAGPGLDVSVATVARLDMNNMALPYDPSLVCERQTRLPGAPEAGAPDSDELPSEGGIQPRRVVRAGAERAVQLGGGVSSRSMPAVWWRLGCWTLTENCWAAWCAPRLAHRRS